MKNNYINVVLNFDKNYLLPASVTMFSIIRNLSKDNRARFFLLVSGWDEYCKNEIFKLKDCEINVIEMEQYLHYFKNVDKNNFKIEYLKSSFSSCYRLFIPKLLPKYVKKIIYVDSDIIVDTNIAEIYYKTTDKDKLFYAVTEYVMATDGNLFDYLNEWKEFSKFSKNSEKYPYFNSGFFIMNLDLARKLNIFKDFMDFLNLHPDCHYCDQDVLNAICGQKYSDKMVYLPPEYNVSCDIENYNNVDAYFKTGYTYNQLKKAFNTPKIYHFVSVHKPWLNKNTKHYREIWYNYFKSSPFYINYSKTKSIDPTKFKNKEIKKNNCENIIQDNTLHTSSIVDAKTEKEWIYLFNILPFIKIKKNTVKSLIKAYLFGFIPIFKITKQRIKIYFLGIQFLTIRFRIFDSK